MCVVCMCTHNVHVDACVVVSVFIQIINVHIPCFSGWKSISYHTLMRRWQVCMHIQDLVRWTKRCFHPDIIWGKNVRQYCYAYDMAIHACDYDLSPSLWHCTLRFLHSWSLCYTCSHSLMQTSQLTWSHHVAHDFRPTHTISRPTSVFTRSIHTAARPWSKEKSYQHR